QRRCWDALRQYTLPRQAESLVSHEEERLVLASIQAWNGNRASEKGAEIVHDQLGNSGAECVTRRKSGVLVVLENAAVVCICPALRNSGDIADTAELGGVVDFTDADFGDSIERRK